MNRPTLFSAAPSRWCNVTTGWRLPRSSSIARLLWTRDCGVHNLLLRGGSTPRRGFDAPSRRVSVEVSAAEPPPHLIRGFTENSYRKRREGLNMQHALLHILAVLPLLWITILAALGFAIYRAYRR